MGQLDRESRRGFARFEFSSNAGDMKQVEIDTPGLVGVAKDREMFCEREVFRMSNGVLATVRHQNRRGVVSEQTGEHFAKQLNPGCEIVIGFQFGGEQCKQFCDLVDVGERNRFNGGVHVSIGNRNQSGRHTGTM